MIKRENLKQAIEAIEKRDPAIGYSLDAMFAMDEISVPEKKDPEENNEDLFFLFKGQRVAIKKYLYFHEGTVPLEQQLLIKYGETVRKQEVRDSSDPADYRSAATQIQLAGLRFMVEHEIDYAVSRIRSELSQLESPENKRTRKPDMTDGGTVTQSRYRLHRIQAIIDLISFLEAVKKDEQSVLSCLKDRCATRDFLFHAQGVIEYVTPALFVPFPFCMDAFLQVAAMNLEFFNTRFLLNCLIENTGNRLYACVWEGKILGLIFLNVKTFFLRQSLEIKYLATTGGYYQSISSHRPRRLKGVGTFLVAGAWLLWKNRFPNTGEMILNAEIGAINFYRSIGFRPRRLFEYVLDQPAGFLLRAILTMVNNLEKPDPELLTEVGDMIEAQIKRLPKNSKGKAAQFQRRIIFSFLRECLESRTHHTLAIRSIRLLFKYRDRLPEASDLLDLAAESGWSRLWTSPSKFPPLLVVYSERFTGHLENIFHLESARRIQALHAMMQHPTLAGKWQKVEPRPAGIDELAWIHTSGHIERIASTAGKTLCTLDSDTQTSELSYEVALLAVGAVFSILDTIWSGYGKRGFACIRPPGHHAEPDRAMGFCLFNNVALGARYLQKRYGVKHVMIVDIDAHHGNGTQTAFYDANDVLYLSLHRFPGYPGTGNFGEVGLNSGEGFTVNVPLGPGCVDRDFIEIIHYLALPLALHFKPDMILVSCGFDLYIHDRLGGMRATPEAYALMGALLVDIAEQVCEGRILFILEGGYSIKGIQECGLYLFQELCYLSPVSRRNLNKIITNPLPKLGALKKAIRIQQRYWPALIA